jgi:hypothetical protein
MRRALHVILVLTSLQGCASVEDLQRRDEATCARNGLQPGASDFTACVQEQQTRREYFLTMPSAM